MADKITPGRTGNIHTSGPVQLSRQNRHNEWLRLYVGGATPQQIADKYKVDRTSVRDAINRALKTAAEERRELADDALQLQLERLEMLYSAHAPVALSPKTDHTKAAKSAEIVLRTLDRLARLQGLDVPQTAEVTVHTITDLDREIAGLVGRLQATARERVGDDLPDTPVLDAVVESVTEVDE